MSDHATEPFTGAAKVETFIKDFNRLRDLVRASSDPDLEAAWDRCERWVFCMTPDPKENPMTDTTHEAPDWENFAKAVLTDWPTGDLEGSVLFDLSLQYGMIKEVPGGYNSDHHIDAAGICPEEGDPWYEYTFGGEAGPGLYSVNDMTKRIEELEAKLAQQDDLVQAAVAAALREAAAVVQTMQDRRQISWAKDILALITPDAQTALDRVVAERRMEGAEIARQAVWDNLNGSQQAEQLCDAIYAAIRAELKGQDDGQAPHAG